MAIPPTPTLGHDHPAAVVRQASPTPGGLEIHPWLQGYCSRSYAAAFLADLRARDLMGRQHYTVPLTTNNGRNARVDAYQEALDLCAYLAQHVVERGLHDTGATPRDLVLLDDALKLADRLRILLNEEG